MSDIESQARQMGWKPQEEFKGDPDKWVDAETYVERGEHVLPLLQANNRRLQQDLLTRDQKIDTLKQELEVTRSIVQGLEKNFTESLERQLKEQRASLKADLKGAIEDRDVDREMEVREQLDQLTEAERVAKQKQEENKKKLEASKPTPTDKDTDPNISPDFNAWKEENPWFGGSSAEDKKRTRAVIRAAEDLRDEGDTSTGREFFDKALARAEPSSDDSPVDKVDGGTSRSNGRSGSGGAKTFASLPAEAKKACMDDVDNFVGEDKLFKTEKDWKEYYAKTYYGE